MSDTVNESSHNDATNESSNDDLPPTNKEIIVIDDDSNQLVNSQMQDRWLIVDQLYLYTSDRVVLLNNKEWLNDNHMTCAQKLIKNQFRQYNGLQNTIL